MIFLSKTAPSTLPFWFKNVNSSCQVVQTKKPVVILDSILPNSISNLFWWLYILIYPESDNFSIDQSCWPKIKCSYTHNLKFLVVTLKRKNKEVKLILITYLTQSNQNIATCNQLKILMTYYYFYFFFILSLWNLGCILHLEPISVQTCHISRVQ